MIDDILLALPEIVFACLSMLLLMMGVFCNKSCARVYNRLAVICFSIAIMVVILAGQGTAFAGMYISDDFSSFIKILVLIGGIFILSLSGRWLEHQNINRFEYPVLIAVATLGMMIMASANNLLTMYMGLELQSLSLYILASFQRDTIKSSEAGLKYFILGSLSSGLLLFGFSLIYGFTGVIGFDDLATISSDPEGLSLGVMVGLVFVLAGLVFKISGAPFHMWTPDVYHGAPTPVTTFFAVAPKIAALGLIMRFLFSSFGDSHELWMQVFVFVSAASMIIGAYAALCQKNIKRLIAYSSIANVGYMLLGLVAGGEDGVTSILVYLVIYAIMTLGVFAVILSMKKQDVYTEQIEDLAGISKTHPFMAWSMGILMFSMSGIPPLAGFFGKLFVFQVLIAQGHYVLAVIGVLASVVAAYYYLRIIQVMFFQSSEPDNTLDQALAGARKFVLSLSVVFVCTFIFYPTYLFDAARTAARALFNA